MSELDMCIRLLAAAGFGVVIGIEREWANKPAGLRTHMLVCVASALLTTTALLIGERLGVRGEATRVTAGVVTGIGFIGAGAILQTKRAVLGLTTAATVFMAAAIGIAAGNGLYYLSLTAAGITLFSTWALRVIDPELGRSGTDMIEHTPRRQRPDRPASPRKREE
jgi:putative Mg2+ transporter-C (MgtC) family protein